MDIRKLEIAGEIMVINKSKVIIRPEKPSSIYVIYHKDREKWGDEGFMLCILKCGALDGIAGTTDYYGE